jgi:SAM-dependent methyltransferase
MPEHLRTGAELADAIRRVAEHASSEMDLQVGVEKVLDPFLPKVPGVTLDHYGHATKLGGIKDALHGNLIIEYERPGKLAKRAGLEEAVGQLQRYLLEEAARHGHQATAALRRMVGVGLDGEQILFVRYRGRESAAAVRAKKPSPQLAFFPEAAPGDFSVDGPHPVSAESIDIFLGFLQSLARYPLTPEALAETFGPKGDTAKQVVGLFYNKVLKSTNRRVQTFFAEWQRIFGIVYGQDIGKAEQDAKALGKQFGVKTVPKLKEFLFAVHTYFALLMKLLAAEVMTMQSGSMLQSFIQPLGSMSSDDSRRALKDLEDGGLFSRQGINNFLEGDFFAWYLSEWDKAMAQELRGLAKALASFDPRTPYLAPEQSRDLLKKLYQYLVPKKLRHDLGEFYTPDWLAEHLLNQLEYDGNLDKRLLDPACGSGTFLVLAVKRMKQWAEDHDPPIAPDVAVRKILENLCGFDLNPIAVIAARTNFLLALGELVRYVRPIEIPVYMCDSVLTPSEYAELFGKGYRIPTAAGEFEIPGEIVTSNQMEKLAALLEQCARGDYSPREFLNRAKRELTVSHQATFDGLKALYESIHKLEKQNRNGIWARWLKNAFAPVFKGKFDYVAGNPPWIRWGYLSDEYRAATLPLWERFGLFSLKGIEARLGSGEKDFSMLFLYSSCRNYLARKGKLGFLITQEVFKSKKAGEGFRRFKVESDDIYLRPVLAADLSRLKPFEGASNKTALIVLERDAPAAYPIPYTVWTASRNPEPDESLEEVLAQVKLHKLEASPLAGEHGAPWQTTTSAQSVSVQKLRGFCAYRAYRGASFDPYGVFYVAVTGSRPDGLLLVENLSELGTKRKIPKTTEIPIERKLIFPAIRGRDISRWHASPSVFVVVPQDPQKRVGYEESWMKQSLPHTYSYLLRFRGFLLSRGSRVVRELAERTAFYTTYGIGEYTFAPFRVVWSRMARDIFAAVVSDYPTPAGVKSGIPTETTSFIPFQQEEEAHYACALLNSAPVRFYIRSFSSGGRGFGAPSIVRTIAIPVYSPQTRTSHLLSDLSRRAHEVSSRLAAKPDDKEAKRELAEVEDQIDRAAAELWGLTDAELAEIRKALEVMR